MTCTGILFSILLAVVFVRNVESLPLSHPEPCEDVPHKLVCGCNDERCKYFENECMVEAFSEIYGESEFKFRFYLFKQT